MPIIDLPVRDICQTGQLGGKPCTGLIISTWAAPAYAVCTTTSSGNVDTTLCVDGLPNGGAIISGNGADRFTIKGGSVDRVAQGNGADTADIQGGEVTEVINQGDGANSFVMKAGPTTYRSVVDRLVQGNDNDTAEIQGGTVGSIEQGGGIDSFTMTGGTVTSLDQNAGFDTFEMSGSHITGLFDNGNDVTFSGGRIGSVNIGGGGNIFRMSGTAQIDTTLNSESGDDTYTLSGTGTSIGGVVSTGSGDDTLTLDGTALGSDLIFEGGSDQLILRSGFVAGSIFMDAGPGPGQWRRRV